MTIKQAERIMYNFYNRQTPITEEDEFLYIEAMNFLIEKTKNPNYMLNLGGYYYELKNFDLALKYYEMAASYDFEAAYECLGYIWYYGRTGEKNYEKAYYYFDKMRKKGNLVATYKIADMYKNGYFVEKSQEKYEEIIEALYLKVKNCRSIFDPIPEVYTRLASIRKKQGKTDDAIDLYLEAKLVLARRIARNAFFGNLNIMKWLIDDLYELIEFDEEDFDFFDLYYLLKTPHEIRFWYDDLGYEVESVMEGEECAVCFNGKWFHGRDEFFKEAVVDEYIATSVYDDLYGFEVIK